MIQRKKKILGGTASRRGQKIGDTLKGKNIRSVAVKNERE